MRDVTDADMTWLTSTLTAGVRDAVNWIAAPHERCELLVGTIPDAVCIDGGSALGLVDWFVEYGLRDLPIAVVDDLLCALAWLGSAAHACGQGSQQVVLAQRGPDGRFMRLPLENGADEHILWLAALNGKPRLPPESFVLMVLNSPLRPFLRAADALRGPFSTCQEIGQEEPR